MAVTPFKTFISGEVLTASDLNSSITRITDSGEDLAFPATQSVDFNGQSLILDADQDSHLTADTDDQIDFAIAGSDNFRMRLDGSIPEFRAEWTDAGATEGPYISVYRNSASPADNDFIGAFRCVGEDDLGNGTVYAQIQAQIADVTDTTEDARIIFKYMSSGTLTEHFRLGAGHLAILFSTDAGAAEAPLHVLYRNSASPADDDNLGVIIWRGEDSVSAQTDYAKLRAIAEDVTDGTEDGYFQFEALRAGAAVTSLSPGILYTAQATTSGTVVDFTIPSGARVIHVMFNSVGTDGTNRLIIQLGDSGGVETSGYLGGCLDQGGATSGNAEGIDVNTATAAANSYNGCVTLVKMDADADTWVAYGTITRGDGATHFSVNGIKSSMDSELTTVRITTEGTPDDFDAGSVNILVE